MPAAAARASTASRSSAKRRSSRCAWASITRAPSGGLRSLEPREERRRGVDLLTGLQQAPARDSLPLRGRRRFDAEHLGDAWTDRRHVGEQEIRDEAHGLETGKQRCLDLAFARRFLDRLPRLRALECLFASSTTPKIAASAS